MTPAADAPPSLCALVGARLCHDLISPLGAIGNGIELLQMTGGGRGGAELALVSDSLSNALGKLRFFRVAFGPADPDARQSFEEAAAITAAAFPGRFTVRWQARSHDMARPLAKAINLALLCLEKSLPLGGEVRIAEDGPRITLAAEGRRTAPPQAAWAHVREGAPLGDLRSDAVQFPLLRECLRETGGHLEIAFAETSARLVLSVPPAP
ncbi:histidine phosphotransferase family protein [soil metagenome]